MKLVLVFLSLALLSPLSATDKPLPPPDESEVIALEPFTVHGHPISNFAIDFQIFVNTKTKRSIKIFITRVLEDTDASDLGLQAGDEIVKIDGVPVAGMDPEVEINSQLGRIFLNREPGALLRLEVVTRRTQKVTLRAQAPLSIR